VAPEERCIDSRLLRAAPIARRNVMKLKLAGATAVAALLVLSGCATASNDEPDAGTGTEVVEETDSGTDDMGGEESMEPGTIVDVAAGTEDFSTLVAAVTAAGLVETLSGDGPFTVFAPTDAAFAALPEGVLDKLLLEENKDTLVKILTYHVVAGEVTSDQIAAGDVATVEGQTVAVTTNDGGVQVNGANVVAADVDASNGVIHVIDAVILPPDVDPAAL
jgi:uncharacterized surface protein with fasciclin (FAS1) repeats